MTDIEYTLISRGKFTKSSPIRNDLHVRVTDIAKSLNVPSYRVIDAFLELCVLRYEAGALDITPGALPQTNSTKGLQLEAKHYDDDVIADAEARDEDNKKTRPSKVMAANRRSGQRKAAAEREEREEKQRNRIEGLNNGEG